MPTKPQTSKEYFTILTLIYAPLLIIQFAFGGVSYYLVSTGQFATDPQMGSTFKMAAIAIVTAGVLASSMISRVQFKSIKQKTTLKEKMKTYRAALLFKWALLEVPSMFCIVCYLVTGHYFVLVLAAPPVVLLINYRPTASGACQDLELPAAEKILVENPNAVIAEVEQSE